MKYFFGVLRILIGTYLFALNWMQFLKQVKLHGVSGSAKVIGYILGFLILLLYSFYLIYGGIDSLRKKNTTLLSIRFRWLGAILGIVVALALFFFVWYIAAVGFFFLTFSIYEIWKLLKQKTSNPTNETVS